MNRAPEMSYSQFLLLPFILFCFWTPNVYQNQGVSDLISAYVVFSRWAMILSNLCYGVTLSDTYRDNISDGYSIPG